MPCRIRITLGDGRTLTAAKEDYEGFYTRPMPWEQVAVKFHQLAAPYADAALRGEIVEAVANLESIPTTELTTRLSRVGLTMQTPAYREDHSHTVRKDQHA